MGSGRLLTDSPSLGGFDGMLGVVRDLHAQVAVHQRDHAYGNDG